MNSFKFLANNLILLSEEDPSQNATDTNTTTSTGPEEQIEESNPMMWLLFIDLLIFGFLTHQTYKASKKFPKEELDNAENFRPKFVKWLFIANGIRTLSLIFIIAFGNPNGNTALSWLNSVLHVLPAFLFVSSYMYLATFLADLYYSSIAYSNHLLKPFLVIFVTGGYLVFIFIALFTLIFSWYSTFFYISEFLMACLYLVLGAITIYYGKRVKEIFTLNTQNKFDSSNEMSKKLNILSNSIGGLFLIKGISGVLSAFGIIKDIKYPNVYDFFWFLILEIAPTAIFMIVGKKKEQATPQTLQDTPRQSSVYEMEYSFSDKDRNPSYRPPFVK